MRRIVADAFAHAGTAFATPFPAVVVDALAQNGAGELSAAYLDPHRRSFLLIELRALESWTLRAALLRERLFPPAAYLSAKYRSRTSPRSRWLLPWWYARRAAEGLWKAARS
jgi:hypothetical protein